MRRKINNTEKKSIPEKIDDNLDLIVSVGGILLGMFNLKTIKHESKSIK